MRPMLFTLIRKGRSRFSIRFTVVSVFLLATLLTTAIAISLQYYFSREMAVESASSAYQSSAIYTSDHVRRIEQSTRKTTSLLARFPNLTANPWENSGTRDLFAQTMIDNPTYYAIYIGFPNSDFYELVNLNSHPVVRKQMNAVAEDRWVVITVKGEDQNRIRRFDYYDEEFSLRATREEPSDYYPSSRIWFENAVSGEVHRTAPYLFQHLQGPGQTFSTRIASDGSVLAVDIALSTVSDYLKNQAIGKESEIYLFQKSGELLASNQYEKVSEKSNAIDHAATLFTTEQKEYLAELKKIRVSNETDWPPIDYTVMGEPQGLSVELLKQIAAAFDIDVEFVNGYSWPELVKKFEQGELDILQPVFPSDENNQRGLYTDAVLQLPYAIASRQGETTFADLTQLSNKTLSIPAGWSIIPILRNEIPDLKLLEVATTREALAAVADGRADAALDSAAILRYTAELFFIQQLQFHELSRDVTASLPDQLHFLVSAEKPQLRDLINVVLQEISPQRHQELRDKWFSLKPSEMHRSAVIPYADILAIATDPTRQDQLVQIIGCECFMYVTAVNTDDETFFAAVVPVEQVLGTSIAKVKTSMMITGACLILLLPICWLFAAPIVAPIKSLALENEKIKRRQYDAVTLHDSRIVELYDLSESIVEMAESIQQHEQAQRKLMDSFIQLIAQAIDDKSPYTGGHCARVPELAIMLAKVASASSAPAFKSFEFKTDDELREYSIAAWLHDCGKITMPEHIVDKATKLETIYNRIHEVRMRFEVLWRDAEISYLKQQIENPENHSKNQAEFETKKKTLTDDFEFVANTNVGGEFLDEARVERLYALAKITWQRHFDDRMGLSQIEEMRFTTPASPLPATEYLLSDKPEHVIQRVQSTDYDPELGINMEIPEHLYNLGELYNLSVSRGTLTAEDRFKINEHMISTIKMLETLPFPPELANVPRYASTHHETLKGTGYPRKLNRDDLGVPDRILAVADIFEALTASDRPYKRAKPVSAALDIMHKMVLDEHIDADVFKLLITSDVYREYAQRFLTAEQLDEVDFSRYL